MQKKKSIWLVLTLIWTVVIILFTLQPGNTSSNLSGSILTRILSWFAPDILNHPTQLNIWHNVLRKSAHFMEYFILGTITIHAVKEMTLKHKRVSAIVYCLFIASLDETIQLFVPGRSGKLTDVMIDFIGALVAILFMIRLANNSYRLRRGQR